MKGALIRFFRGTSLRQRFLVTPLLGLIVCVLLTIAFVYESQRQNALLVRTEQDLAAFNRYGQVFVNLTARHTALFEILSIAAKLDEATLYDEGKQHLFDVQKAVLDLEQALPPVDGSTPAEVAALRSELSASAQAYRKGVSAAVAMATVNLARVPGQLVIANERFVAMNRALVRFLDLKREGISAEIAARVRQSRIGTMTIAIVGVSIALLLFFLSGVLARILCRSIETQITALTDLGAQAGASLAVDGNDEVERMARAIAAFRQSLQSNKSLTIDLNEMKRLDRMKSEFVSMVSHELRTPLTSIRGSLGLVAGGVAGKLPDAAMALIDIAKNNCERLIRLINNILDTEKIEAGTLRFELGVIELEPLVVQSIAANEGFAAQHHVRLELLANAHGARVNADSDGLSQVITNLLSNAVKYSPSGAVVKVSIARIAGRLRVEVRDSGAGIPEEFLPRIFERFSQADSSDSRQRGGTGLGLNISRAIMERLGGTIGFDTAAGAGTCFHFEMAEWQGEAPVPLAHSVAAAT